MKNRQLRTFVFMLYPDNQKHSLAVDYLDLLENSLYVKHIEKKDNNGDIINKEHWHCVLRFDNPYWLSKLLSDLGLDESDSHLFHSYSDFKDSKGRKVFKSIEDYILYLDHQDNPDKPDKYTIDDFHGGLVNWARGILSRSDDANYIKFLDCCMFIRNYNLENFFDCQRFTFLDWYNICYKNGYGSVFYSNWYRMRDILNPYLNIK